MEQVPYNFEKSSWGFYGVFETSLKVRLLKDHLGVGALFQFKMPSMWQSGAETDVTIDWANVQQSEAFQELSAFGSPEESDVRNSPIGHMDALNLMTLGLTADWRF
jgi:hypothetical protein